MIGVVGVDVPVEIIESCGARAYRLSAVDRQPTVEAVRLLGGAVDASAHSILDQILAGDFDFLRGLVISRDSQSSLRLFYVLRALAAEGRTVPPIHLVDLLHIRRESTRKYNVDQIDKFAAAVAQWTGRTHTIENLRTACTVRAELAGRLREVRARRSAEEPTVSGTTALRLYALSQTVPPEESLSLTDSILSAREPVAGRVRIFVTGSAHDHDHDYAALEAGGAQVVGEDHSWGDPLADLWTEVGEATHLGAAHSTIAAHRLQCSPLAQTSGLGERARYSAECVRRSGAQAVLSLVRRNDPAPGWDYPSLVEELDSVVPTAKLTGATYSWQREELVAAIEQLEREECEASTR
ncbi:2-hydroxyacyl-CoA dehydratase family protein [Rhodococcus jostii]|uniref:2-hydroxyacyl-CoA dehydratase family protein n=1 Tax=Rhodococcus jostii TaxID=132919 RepID=UPI000933DCD2|nr:2-hydroxyacyl-CoA dehydratase family protein [Rhodococcus jostii]